MKPKVKFEQVSKKYSLFQKKSDVLLDIFSLKRKEKSFYALKNVSFEVAEGETIGIIGINGSGKSTLSNLLAGIVPPTTGDVEINGETSLVAISAGLNNALSGMENIRLKCLMHGLTQKEIDELTPEIVEFADLGDFIHQPIKTYSSGMKSRLGFAISVHIKPDILIIDEALSVGDQTFYEKCVDKFNEFKRQGKTIFFISHSISQIRSISDRVLWMHFGEVKEFGETETVLKNYQNFIKWFNTLSETEKKEHRASSLEQQMNNTSRNQNAMTSRTDTRRLLDQKKKKKKKGLLGLQFAGFFFVFLLSIILLFAGNPVSLFSDILANGQASPETEMKEGYKGREEAVKIEREALLSAESTSFYGDIEMSNKIADIPFASKLYIYEKQGDIYRIIYDGEEGYISETELVEETTFGISELSLEDFLPVFPSAFANSYQFALAHLNETYDDIKEKFGGLTGEETDQFENQLLIYSGENMTFQFKDGIAEAIVVSPINVLDPGLESILEKAYLTSKDGNRSLILTDNYRVIIDKENELIAISLGDDTEE